MCVIVSVSECECLNVVCCGRDPHAVLAISPGPAPLVDATRIVSIAVDLVTVLLNARSPDPGPVPLVAATRTASTVAKKGTVPWNARNLKHRRKVLSSSHKMSILIIGAVLRDHSRV